MSAGTSALLGGLHILVVEDQYGVRVLVARVLEHAGASVTAVGSTREALTALALRTPDVIVTDIRMPGEDGYVLMQKVRALPEERGGRIPAVAISASIDDDEAARLRELGFQRFVRKPFDAGQLRDAVAIVAGRAVP
jgi:CheY-like chemotaxis protein